MSLGTKHNIGKQIVRCSEITGIDATVIADTKIFHVPFLNDGLSVQNFAPFALHIEVTSFTSGGKATEAIINVGDTGASYNDWINGKTVTISGTKQLWISLFDSEFKVFTSGSDLYLRIATASDATIELWTVQPFGFMW